MIVLIVLALCAAMLLGALGIVAWAVHGVLAELVG
jgi:hypothetical protein